VKTIAEIFASYEELDAIGRHINGTDKHGPNHRYGHAYEEIIRTIRWRSATVGEVRDCVQLMMEIGVADGSSLLAWREVFPEATCVGMDIMPNPISKLGGVDRVEFCVGDMYSLADCRRAARGRLFDFICEDATHKLSDTLRTLLFLWPHVRPGGIYVIEEFDNIGDLRGNIAEMWPHAEIVDTQGPHGGIEPLVVLRKPI
jgi:hypothetical protein